MFAQLTQAFDFRYVVVTMHDIKDEIDVGNTSGDTGDTQI